MLCTSGFMDGVIFARKPRLLDVAAQLKRSAHEALGLAIIIILYYAIYGSTHKYKKAKIHLKYNLKYKNDMNTNITP